VEPAAATSTTSLLQRAIPVAPTRAARRLRAADAWLEANALFAVAVAAIAVLSFSLIPNDLNQDGWLALIGGRFIAQHGIPHHDTLNALTHGAGWVDQQWLAQLVIYELDRIGGLALYSIVYIALMVAGFAMALAASHKLGGSERHVLWVMPLASFLFVVGAFQIRTQGFAYPLFVATLWLLADAIRSPERRRVYLIFPLLILWGNLHGSVTLGAGLAMLYGLILSFEDVRAAGWRRPWGRLRGRSIAFLVASPLCLAVNPYGFGIIKYYDVTLLNSTFSKVVTEWQPVTSLMILAVPFFALAFVTIWVLGRSGARTHTFDHLTLLILAAGAVFALRNVVWFGLACMILLPRTIGTVRKTGRARMRHTQIDLALAGLSAAIIAGMVIATAVKPASWFERKYDQRTVAAVAAVAARDPSIRIFSDIRFSDWLLWHDPALAGHIAYDTRLELLTNNQIVRLANLTQLPKPGQRDILAGYRLLVLDTTDQPTTKILLARPGTHVIMRGKRVVVATTLGT
jgi:hypothetical protein